MRLNERAALLVISPRPGGQAERIWLLICSNKKWICVAAGQRWTAHSWLWKQLCRHSFTNGDKNISAPRLGAPDVILKLHKVEFDHTRAQRHWYDQQLLTQGTNESWSSVRLELLCVFYLHTESNWLLTCRQSEQTVTENLVHLEYSSDDVKSSVWK